MEKKLIINAFLGGKIMAKNGINLKIFPKPQRGRTFCYAYNKVLDLVVILPYSKVAPTLRFRRNEFFKIVSFYALYIRLHAVKDYITVKQLGEIQS